MPGWGIIFEEDFIQDGTVAITMGFLFFILPRDRPEFLCNSSGDFHVAYLSCFGRSTPT